MPLFQCSECYVIENTALGDFWSRQAGLTPGLPICSQCATGKWHGRFAREVPMICDWEPDPLGEGLIRRREKPEVHE